MVMAHVDRGIRSVQHDRTLLLGLVKQIFLVPAQRLRIVTAFLPVEHVWGNLLELSRRGLAYGHLRR